MKKYLIVLLSLFIVFSFSSCSNDNSAEQVQNYDKSAELIKNYADFASSFEKCASVYYALDEIQGANTGTKDLATDTSLLTTAKVEEIYKVFFGEDIDVIADSIVASGSIVSVISSEI